MYFIKRLRLEAHRAHLRCIRRQNDVTAIATFPYTDSALAKHLMSLDIVQKCTITLLVVPFYLAYPTKLPGKRHEALFFRLLGKTVVHIRPLIILTLGGMQQINRCVIAYTAKSLTPQARMLALVFSSLAKYRGNLLKPVARSHIGEICIFVSGHALSGKRLLQILFRARTRILVRLVRSCRGHCNLGKR